MKNITISVNGNHPLIISTEFIEDLIKLHGEQTVYATIGKLIIADPNK